MTQSRLIPWTQTHSIRWYGPGEHCEDPVPGDLFLVATPGTTARAIQAGQWLVAHISEPELKPYTWCNHAAIIRDARSTDVMGNGSLTVAGMPIVSQMSPKLWKAGHEYAPLWDYVHTLYGVIHFDMDDNDRQYLLDADDSCAFIQYGYAQYPGLVIAGLTGMHVGFSIGNAMICSVHTTHCASNLSLRPDRPESGVMPAHIAMWVDAKPPQQG